MKRVTQKNADDCFACCVASILEIDRKEVPSFTGGPNQIAQAQRWLARRFGLTLATILVPFDKRLSDILPEGFGPWRFIAVVPVQGGKYWHAVVGEARGDRARVIHDPAGWGRIELSKANEIRLILPVFKRGIPWRPMLKSIA